MYRTLLAALMPLALGLRGTSESLRKALVNVGLELTEQHLYGQQRSEEAPPFMVLMPGLKGRVCRLAAHDAKLKELRSEMRARGYLMIDRNDNPFCGHCSEVLFVLEDAPA